MAIFVILLMDNTPSEDFVSAIEEAGLYDRLDLTEPARERPRWGCTMACRHSLVLDSTHLQACCRAKLHAFSLATASELNAIDGVIFPVRSLRVRVRRAVAEKGPYYRRMLSLERVRGGPGPHRRASAAGGG